MSYGLVGITVDGKEELICLCNKDSDIETMLSHQPKSVVEKYVRFQIEETETPY